MPNRKQRREHERRVDTMLENLDLSEALTMRAGLDDLPDVTEARFFIASLVPYEVGTNGLPVDFEDPEVEEVRVIMERWLIAELDAAIDEITGGDILDLGELMRQAPASKVGALPGLVMVEYSRLVKWGTSGEDTFLIPEDDVVYDSDEDALAAGLDDDADEDNDEKEDWEDLNRFSDDEELFGNGDTGEALLPDKRPLATNDAQEREIGPNGLFTYRLPL